jgi:sugar phosphate isomerase/epimerase
MQLAISNLAWPSTEDDVVFDLLAPLGVSGVEVAPTRLAAWDALPASRLIDYRRRLEGAGLVASSLQAVLFGRPELQLLGEGAAFDGMLEHMRHVAGIGEALGAGVLVFGSPRNRLLDGMAPDRAWARACERLRLLGEITFAAGVIIGVEPVPAVYGGDFLMSWSDVLSIVQDIDHPGVRVHLDTGCVALGGDSIEAAIVKSRDLLAHFHAAQPQLGNFQVPLFNHRTAAAALHTTGYDHWVSIEMREQPGGLAAVKRAILTVSEIYGQVALGCPR